MKRWSVALGCLFCLLVTMRPASGSWAYVSLEELVATSDLIVVGTLHDVTHDVVSASGGEIRLQGTIEVQQVLWGEAKQGAKLPLRWDEVGCGTGFESGVDRPQIWLLKQGRCGTVRADYPGHRRELKERATVLELLRRNPLCISTTAYEVLEDGPVEVTMIFRNATARRITFPAFSYREGKLWLPPHSTLNTIRFPWEALPSGEGRDSSGGVLRRGKTAVTTSHEQVTVEPGQAYRVTIDLADLYRKLPTEFGFTLKGFGRSNVATFYPLSRREYAEWQKVNETGKDEDDPACAFVDADAESHWAYQAVPDIPGFLPTPAPERNAPSRLWSLALLLPLLIARWCSRVVVSKPVPL